MSAKTPETEQAKAIGSGPTRESHWEELDADGKIERCRREIKRRDRIIETMSAYLNKLIVHQHVNDKLVHPIGHPNVESAGAFYYRKRPDEFF